MRYTIHNTVEVGNPVRVFVNGNLIDNALIADTKRGEVIFAPSPFRINKNSETVYTRKLRGVVTVEPING